jgi:imidazolonepropionase-like amidohydrolase
MNDTERKTNGTDPTGAAWHIQAVRLPEGNQVEEWWVHQGVLHHQLIPGAQELPGGWVIPGLVDAHAHLSMDFNHTGLPMGSDALINANMQAQLRAGVLAVRDTGAVPGAKLDLNPPYGPRILASGRFLAPPGRYFGPLFEGVAAEDLVEAALAEVEQGATWVKIIADFPGPDGNWFAPQVNYPAEALRKLVEAVHAAGARVAAHVSDPVITKLVQVGVDSIEHGPLLNPQLLAEMADRGIAWTPTLATVAGVTEQMAKMNGPIGAVAREALVRLHETIPLAAQLGVPILTGTDEAPHGALAREVAQLCRFGLPVSTALAAASTTARAYLGLPGLEQGAPADLVTFDTDPRENLEALAKPAAVLLGGRRVI